MIEEVPFGFLTGLLLFGIRVEPVRLNIAI